MAKVQFKIPEIKPEQLSKADRLKLLPIDQRTAFWKGLTKQQKVALMSSDDFRLRPVQRAPDPSQRVTIFSGGRGTGKSFCGSCYINHMAKTYPGSQLTIIGATHGEIQDYMINGPSGILATAQPDFVPTVNWAKLRITYPNGSVVTSFTGERPETLRGNNSHAIWCDEIFKYRHAEEMWKQIQLICRAPGHINQILMTTSPRTTAFAAKILENKKIDVRHASVFENMQLSQEYIDSMVEEYGDSTWGIQELLGIMVPMDEEMQLFGWDDLNDCRISEQEAAMLEFTKTIIAVDPTISTKSSERKTGDECGIIVASKDSRSRGILRSDLSKRCSPSEWVRISCKAYYRYDADEIYVESNAAGEEALKALYKGYDPTVKLKFVRSNDSKGTRASPVSDLSKKHRLIHVGEESDYEKLEKQLTEFDVEGNPRSFLDDRFDAYVHAFTRLLVNPKTVTLFNT